MKSAEQETGLVRSRSAAPEGEARTALVHALLRLSLSANERLELEAVVRAKALRAEKRAS